MIVCITLILDKIGSTTNITPLKEKKQEEENLPS